MSVFSALLPVLAVTVVPAVLLLAVAYALRPQVGRHARGMVVTRPAGWSPYDVRVRAAFRYYAPKRRERVA